MIYELVRFPMAYHQYQEGSPVLVQSHPALRIITLNRPQVMNNLNLAMVRSLRHAFEEARETPSVKMVLLNGAGDQGFCAGGDLKALAQVVKRRDWERARQFFQEEYDLDLLIHNFPKTVVVLADGITMGGGLGLAAGADLVIATERTRMAMPETIIGFFPDVGATGWLFSKCPPGIPAGPLKRFSPERPGPQPGLSGNRIIWKAFGLVLSTKTTNPSGGRPARKRFNWIFYKRRNNGL